MMGSGGGLNHCITYSYHASEAGEVVEAGRKGANIQFKELLKQKKEQEQRLQHSNNPFLAVAKKPDYSIYNSLYKFDVKQELQDYNLPFAGTADPHHPPPPKVQPMAASKVSSMFEGSEAPSREEEEQSAPEASSRPNYTEITKGLWRESSQKPQNKIQNALFVDKSVSNMLKSIKTGDMAISFFAKYTNTTPIKFINCIQRRDSEEFRPYDLEVISSN